MHPNKVNSNNYNNTQDGFKHSNNLKQPKYQHKNKYEESIGPFVNLNNYHTWTDNSIKNSMNMHDHKSIHRNKPITPQISQSQNINTLYNSNNYSHKPIMPYSNKHDKINSNNTSFNTTFDQKPQSSTCKSPLNYLLMVNSPKEKKISEQDNKNKKKTQISFDSLKLNFSNKKKNSIDNIDNTIHSGQIQVNRSYEIKTVKKSSEGGIYTNQNIGNRTQRNKRENHKRSSIALFKSPTNSLYQSQQVSQYLTHKFTAEDFQKVKELGNGKYGRVILVRYIALLHRQKSTNFICALKLIQKKLLKEEQIIDQFIRELKIQLYLNHPNIVKMYGFFEDPINIYIILEVATGGQLYHLLKKSQSLPENKIAYYMRQVCEAVKEIHSLRIIHRDIKPQNIVIHDNVAKLCDFGWSVRQDTKLRTTFCGTPLYVCPEILKGVDYNQKIDIWSLGIMMYQMIAGESPFRIKKQQQLIKIIKEQVKIPSYVHLSKELESLLYICLNKNPRQRGDIRQIIEHDFFKKYPDKQVQKNKMATYDSQ